MEKLIITAAICGAEVTKEHNPAVPYTVSEIAREAKSAADAGAAIIHLHVRDDDGTPTQSKERFAQCIAAIREYCPDTIIQVTTGGATWMTADERLAPVELSPEMATLDCGTCNFGDDDMIVNSIRTIREFAKRMDEFGVKPEIEVFEKGMVDTALELCSKGVLKSPAHFNFVLGVKGAMNGDARNLTFLADTLPSGFTYTVSGIGRHEMPLAAAAIAMGGHVRVGFEDNVYIEKGVLARSNGELVEKVARMAGELGRQIASPAEARRILNL